MARVGERLARIGRASVAMHRWVFALDDGTGLRHAVRVAGQPDGRGRGAVGSTRHSIVLDVGEKPTMNRARLLLMLVAFALSASACAPRGARETPVDPLFVDATSRLGEDVVVHGVLRWQDGYRELLTVSGAGAAGAPRPCLPILIPLGEQSLADAATQLNGKHVRVEGVIVDAVARGMVTTPSCQPVGVRVAVLVADE